MIPREIIDEILYRSDITDVIGSYVSLKRAGSNMSGLCPFHSEKSPSFTVFPATKSFYCFGCGAGGDVITFIKKAENIDYPSAVEFLAARAGITIPEDKKYVKDGEVSRRRVYDMNLEAAKFFRQCLFDEKIGAPGREYLAKRKLSGATIKHFGLGFAPDSFNMLTDHLKSKGFSDNELTTAFLCGKSKKTGRCYDYFRGKVMFPVIDVAGNIIAFGGRVLDNSKPKYINSSDTPGFKKSRNLFALNFAKNCCSEEIILCEGDMDVIALHAAGFENAVATLGTAITPEQARLMAKYTKKVIISYDGDAAGQNATNKAMKLLSEVGLEVRVLTIPDNMDPDDYIKAHGPDRFKKLLEGGKTGFEFKLNGVLSKFYDKFKIDLDNALSSVGEGKVSLAAETTDLTCEKCGATMIVKSGRFGKFAACPNYPTCKNTRSLTDDAKPETVEKQETETTDLTCEKCGAPMVTRHGKYGKFFACSAFPKCRHIVSADNQIDVPCPICGKEIVTKRAKGKTLFYSCSGYPECQFSSWDKPTKELCPSCGKNLFVKKGKDIAVCTNKDCERHDKGATEQ